MDLLTDSQLRIINEFRERVRQSEKRLRETLDSRGMRDANPSQQPDSNYNSLDSLKANEYKVDKYDSFTNSRPAFQKPTTSPLEETLPQRLLKPVVFNAGSPNGLESIMRLSESLKSDHRNPYPSGTENKPPARKEYESFNSNPPSAKFESHYQPRIGEKDSMRDNIRDLPQRTDDSLIKSKFNSTIDQSYTRSPNHSYDISPANYSRIDSYPKKLDDYKPSTLTNTSSGQIDRDNQYLYFIESGKQNRLAVPSIRLFEYDRKDEPPVRERRNSNPQHPEEDYNVRASYKSQKKSPERISPIRRSPLRRGGEYESFDLGAKRPSGTQFTSPQNVSAEGLDTFGNRSVPKRRRSNGSKGNILAYEDYKMNDTASPMMEREGRRTFSHPEKKKVSISTPTKSNKKNSTKALKATKTKEKERDESVKQREQRAKEAHENEPRRLCKELIRRLKLGTLDTNKFISVMEDHMFFSTRFLENLKTIIKK